MRWRWSASLPTKTRQTCREAVEPSLAPRRGGKQGNNAACNTMRPQQQALRSNDASSSGSGSCSSTKMRGRGSSSNNSNTGGLGSSSSNNSSGGLGNGSDNSSSTRRGRGRPLPGVEADPEKRRAATRARAGPEKSRAEARARAGPEKSRAEARARAGPDKSRAEARARARGWCGGRGSKGGAGHDKRSWGSFLSEGAHTFLPDRSGKQSLSMPRLAWQSRLQRLRLAQPKLDSGS